MSAAKIERAARGYGDRPLGVLEQALWVGTWLRRNLAGLERIGVDPMTLATALLTVFIQYALLRIPREGVASWLSGAADAVRAGEMENDNAPRLN